MITIFLGRIISINEFECELENILPFPLFIFKLFRTNCILNLMKHLTCKTY